MEFYLKEGVEVETHQKTPNASMRLGLIDGNVTAVEVLAIHAFDRILHGILVVEGDEAEAPGLPISRSFMI
ncbi:hypothetical protein Pyn_16048 [Prunus yedoensis var. nudiflora]|uniref:Uncharacterized protein n=1 Tax=Prunus yedoensis var. nudiflora TaxID=2094558 RepID=A0A314YCK9_PRUYE|nr:hypothetical protein Pyn_16048 [Prunus yedoensis var. nudiflora]